MPSSIRARSMTIMWPWRQPSWRVSRCSMGWRKASSPSSPSPMKKEAVGRKATISSARALGNSRAGRRTHSSMTQSTTSAPAARASSTTASAISARPRSRITATRSPSWTLRQVRTALRAPAAYSASMARSLPNLTSGAQAKTAPPAAPEALESRSTPPPATVRRRGRAGGRSVAVAVDDATAREVVRRQLDADAVARGDPDEVATHPTRGVGDQPVAVVQLHLEHGVGQRLGHGGVEDDRLFLLDLALSVGVAGARGVAAWPPVGSGTLRQYG